VPFSEQTGLSMKDHAYLSTTSHCKSGSGLTPHKHECRICLSYTRILGCFESDLLMEGSTDEDEEGESILVNVLYVAAPNAFSSSLIFSAWFQGSWAGAGGRRVCKKLTLIPDDLPLATDRGRV